MHVRCPHCHSPLELLDDASFSDIECPSCGSSFSLVDNLTATISHRGETKTIGHFELTHRLGVGAFGSVWKARDQQLDRLVAIKIPRNGDLDAEQSENFFREARAAAQLKHPNIVSVFEVGRHDGQIYIVSAYVAGVTLADRLTSTPFTAREAVEICAKVADALHHAHEAGVIHRDLKPSNIMLDEMSEPHVMDFGLAKRETGEMTMTVDGQILGTPAYMSPEQAKGEAHQADPRSDVYSLGVILFELLTGERPFRGNQRMLLHQVLNEDAPSLRRLNNTISRDLDTICSKAMSKAPAKRYHSASAFAQDLRRFLNHEPILARPTGRLERLGRWCRRNPSTAMLTTTILTLLSVLAIGAGIAALSINNSREQLRQTFGQVAQQIEELRKDTEQYGEKVKTFDNLASEFESNLLERQNAVRTHHESKSAFVTKEHDRLRDEGVSDSKRVAEAIWTRQNAELEYREARAEAQVVKVRERVRELKSELGFRKERLAALEKLISAAN